MDLKIEGPRSGQSSLCIPILRLLPGWFGIEEAILDYERKIEQLPTWLANADGQALGFLCLKQHNLFSAEILVMAVIPAAQRGGIGRTLLEVVEVYTRELGVEYLQVKTLGSSRPDEGYARTRGFYQAMGFRPLEEFKQIWDKNNPCLVMVKRL
jgi:ribosomal protein S18 acetylase RimI-like enzyme